MDEIEKLLEWAKTESWCEAMMRCPQEAEWHGEGDVWTHTEMVCDCLADDPEYKTLDKHSRLVLAYAAILHDIGKPEVTTQIDGVIDSPSHTLVGEKISRRVLIEKGLDVVTREEICMLVRYHGYPLTIRFKDNPEEHVIWSSWLTNHKLLYILAKADIYGRISGSVDERITWLQLWKDIAEKLLCFDKPFSFANDHARVLFYERKLSNVYYTPHTKNQFDVIMLSGLPGAGKSFWRNKFVPELSVVELDKIRNQLKIEPDKNQGKVIQEATEQCRKFLRKKQTFVFDATNVTKLIRKRWLNLFFDYGARVRIVYVERPVAEIFENNRKRVKPVPEGIIQNLIEKLEPPDWSEAHEVQYHVPGGD